MAKKVLVKKDVCIGCGLCPSIASRVFFMCDDGLAQEISPEISDDLVAEAEEARESCPVAAIDVE